MAAIVNCFCCVGAQAAARAVSDENVEQAQAPTAETHRANAQDLGERRTSVLGEVFFGSRASVRGGVPAQAAGHAAPGQVAPVVGQARDGGEDDNGTKRDPVGCEALFTARGIKVVAVTSVVTIDTTSDVALGVVQAASGDTRGFLTLGIVAFSLVGQGYVARVLQEDELNQFLALVGVKPAVDAYRVVFGVPKPEGVIASNQQMLVYSRLVEATTESFFQVGLLCDTVRSSPSSLLVYIYVVGVFSLETYLYHLPVGWTHFTPAYTSPSSVRIPTTHTPGPPPSRGRLRTRRRRHSALRDICRHAPGRLALHLPHLAGILDG